jgi:hypothetical protein
MHRASRKPMSLARSASLTRRVSRKNSARWRAKHLLRRLATARSYSAAKRSQSRAQRRKRALSSTYSIISMRQCRPIIRLTSKPRRKSETNTRLSAPMPSKADKQANVRLGQKRTFTYSITSSARASSDDGTSRPSVLAVLLTFRCKRRPNTSLLTSTPTEDETD